MNAENNIETSNETPAPVVFWRSQPVRPDETVLLTGDGLADGATVEVWRYPDGVSGAPEAGIFSAPDTTGVAVVPLQGAADALQFVVPPGLAFGVFACRISNGAGCSAWVMLNAPDVWWVQGNLGFAASPGGWLRVFGNCLHFDVPSRILLRAENGGATAELTIDEATCYALSAVLPATLPPGSYEVWVHNGYGAAAAWACAGRFAVQAPRCTPEAVLNVMDFGARPNTQEDCTLAIVQGMERLAGLGGAFCSFHGDATGLTRRGARV